MTRADWKAAERLFWEKEAADEQWRHDRDHMFNMRFVVSQTLRKLPWYFLTGTEKGPRARPEQERRINEATDAILARILEHWEWVTPTRATPAAGAPNPKALSKITAGGQEDVRKVHTDGFVAGSRRVLPGA